MIGVSRDEDLKRTLPPGPWQEEPDRIEWRSHGFPCLMVRNRLGAWCGYVAVPPGHPWHGQRYSEVAAEAHGGLTYGGECAGKICHVPQPGEAEDVFWLGFDCAHAWDVSPGLLKYGSAADQWYRDVEYVTDEVERLAEQAAAAQTAAGGQNNG